MEEFMLTREEYNGERLMIYNRSEDDHSTDGVLLTVGNCFGDWDKVFDVNFVAHLTVTIHTIQSGEKMVQKILLKPWVMITMPAGGYNEQTESTRERIVLELIGVYHACYETKDVLVDLDDGKGLWTICSYKTGGPLGNLLLPYKFESGGEPV
jgi:hypothetical protein